MKLMKYKNRHIRGANSESFFSHDLFDMFREQEIEIQCYETKEDVTAKTLTRVIFDRELTSKSQVNKKILFEAIRMGGIVEYIRKLERSSLISPSLPIISRDTDKDIMSLKNTWCIF